MLNLKFTTFNSRTNHSLNVISNMKQTFLPIIAILTFTSVKAQKFDIKDFNEKTEIAEWLYAYDSVAWWSTDSLMTKDKSRIAQLGKEWFCFKDSTDVWHSVYGKYDNGNYNQVFHFIVKSRNEVIESSEKINPDFLNAHAKALAKAFEQSKNVRDSSGLRFNNYIKQNNKGNFDVYILPAFQPDGTAIFGGEFIYEITPENQIIHDKSYFQGQFRGYKTGNPREIWLNFRELEKPTLGSVFFAWYYKDYFTKIFIDNKESFSTPFNDGGKYTWLHVEKDLKKEAREKRKKERNKKK